MLHRSLLLLVVVFVLCCLATGTTTTALTITVSDPVVHFAIGALSGAAGAIAAYPLDTIKSQLQASTDDDKNINAWTIVQDVVIRQKQPWNLYRGLGVQIAGIAPEKSIKLGVYDCLMQHSHYLFADVPSLPLPVLQALCGGLAGACQVIASSPLEVLKVGLQTSSSTTNFGDVWKSNRQGLFRGADACMLRDISWTAVCFPLYAALLHTTSPFVAGAVSGVIASAIATPADVLKTRIISYQNDDMVVSVPAKEPREASSPAAAAVVVVGALSTTTSSYPPPSVSSSTTTNVYAQKEQGRRLRRQSNKNTTTPSVWTMAQLLVQQQSNPNIFFTGLTERCVGAIPRFGTTLALHDLLEHWWFVTRVAQESGGAPMLS